MGAEQEAELSYQMEEFLRARSGAANLFFFIRISSFKMPRKFHFQNSSKNWEITCPSEVFFFNKKLRGSQVNKARMLGNICLTGNQS